MLRITRTTKKTLAAIALLVIGSASFGQVQDLNSALRMTYQEQFDAADKAFSELSAKEPANGKYFYYSGENQLASYFIDPTNIPFDAIAKKAIERYNKGIAANPNEPLNYVGLGKVALIQNNKTVADENIAKAQTFLPAKKVKSSLTKPEQATLLVRLADAFVQVGSKDSALIFGFLRRAESLDSKNPELYLVRGDYWFYTLNNGSRAAENYKRAQDFSPNSTRARVRLGQLYTRIRSYQDALNYYQEALAIDPSFAPAYLEMGFLYAKMKQPEESKTNFKKYLDLSSSNIAAKRRYANMLIQTEDYKGAIEQINQIMAMDSLTFNDLNRALAYSYYEEKQYPQANFYMAKFITNAPSEKITAKDYIYSGHILLKSSQDSIGILTLMKAFELDTTNVDLLTEIATLYLKNKKPQNAGDTYKLKIQHTNGSVNDYYKMGRAYFDAKNWAEADSAFAKVNRMSIDFEPAYLFRARVYSNLDPETKDGLAKPFYEKLIEKASADSVKYSKDMLEAYNYLGYYYLVNKQYCESLMYWDKIVAIDPANENANSALKDLKPRCPEFKSANSQ
ncbi:MAG: tetratricopeptide repeat protein [Bacteroidales bacterium]|nr:tetratricopeptide repeat protein [Bacteroidales bacterium]